MDKYTFSKILILTIFSVLGLVLSVEADITEKHTAIPDLNCRECHTCDKPTAGDMCLKPCPSLTMTELVANHKLKEAPDSFVIGEISDVYQPVRFNHKLHAEMAGMGSDCATCHHYSPSGRIPPCVECHGGEKNPANLRQPSLKGAYHRQCLSCHREWSHETKCIICHLPTAGREAAAGGYDSTDIIGISHPVITTPISEVYHTAYEEGPVVTFHHNEHVNLFDIKCVNCHQQENCSNCHDLQKGVEKTGKTMEQVHAVCGDCHGDIMCDKCQDKDKCKKCHDVKEKPAFSHASTGWPLNRFHKNLDCRSCHPTGRKIARLNNKCSFCHGGWNQDNFKHAVTGLVLSEIHMEAECSDCHADLRYDKPVSCANCHDEGDVDPKETPPGEYVN